MQQKTAPDRKALARHWLEEMAANNAIENNPLDAEDLAFLEKVIDAGLSPEQIVARIIEGHRTRTGPRLDAAE